MEVSPEGIRSATIAAFRRSSCRRRRRSSTAALFRGRGRSAAEDPSTAFLSPRGMAAPFAPPGEKSRAQGCAPSPALARTIVERARSFTSAASGEGRISSWGRARSVRLGVGRELGQAKSSGVRCVDAGQGTRLFPGARDSGSTRALAARGGTRGKEKLRRERAPAAGAERGGAYAPRLR